MRLSGKTFRYRIFCFLMLGLFIAAQVKAQEKEKLIFENYTIKDGLPGNWIRSIDEDSYGYLWIATDAGISRYDGFRFKNYFNDPTDSTSLISNEVSQILVDHSEHVWAVTPNGIDRLNRVDETFDHFQNDPNDPNSLPSDRVLILFESSDHSFWVGTSYGLAKYDPIEENFTVFRADSTNPASLPSNIVTSLAESADGRIWIGTDKGIAIYDSELDTFTNYEKDPTDPNELPYDQIQNLFIDNDQYLWVNGNSSENPGLLDLKPGDPSGLWKLNLKTGEKIIFTYNSDDDFSEVRLITKFIQDHKSIIWLGSLGYNANSLKRYDPDSGIFHTYTYEKDNPASLAWSYVESVFEDSNNILWVGTSRGLSKADRDRLQLNSFAPVPEHPFDLRNNIYGMTEVKKDLFWFTSDGGESYRWDKKSGKVQDIPYGGSYVTEANLPPLSGQHIGILGSEGLVWFVNSDFQLGSIDINSYETNFYSLVNNKGSDFTINSIVQGPDNLILILTSLGLYSFNQIDKSVSKLSDLKVSGSAEQYLFGQILESTDSSYWLLSNLTEVNENTNRQEITLARYSMDTNDLELIQKNSSYLSSLGHGSAVNMMEDKNGELWISKSNGLARLNPVTGNTQFYDKSNGLPYLSVIGTLEGDDGNIWISLSNGIARLKPETGRVRNFTKDDGLLPSRMNLLSMYKREYGELMFGGVGGINFFHPTDITETTGQPRVLITLMTAGKSDYKFDPSKNINNPIEIKWSDNTLDISYSAITFQSPELITYEYKLTGFNEDWISVGNRDFAQYTNLPPGTYTFNVRAVNGEGISSETSSLAIRILPPWWRTWIAYISYGFFFVSGIFGADRYQRKRLIQQEQNRNREKELAQAKEIEKAYTNLQKAQDQLIQQEKLASLGQLTAGIAHEIKNPLNFVNNFSELSVELIEETKDELSSISDQLSAEDREKVEEAVEILHDIEMNLRKIHEHGSRADSIVKSMLEHSRGGTGKLEPTDLNALVKEFVNLSFHGMRAGKNPINVDLNYELDETIGEVPLIAEDFSRVIVNLCNNAFDAMREKANCKDLQGFENLGGLDAYHPKLTIRTHQQNSGISVEIEDNGPGIPEEIKDKIMQPFFTTKKGTEGTGLGLSITNDIIKAHGGDLKVKTKEGNGSVLVISLPNSESRI